jgi:HAE1 family hydrophobic/amphiphilic exporter-1
VRINRNGSTVRVRDVARVQLGCDLEDTKVFYGKGQPAAAITIRQEPAANALDTAKAIKAKMEELSRYFPHGMKVIYPYDTTPFTRVAIMEVAKTLVEAIGLVFLVMYLFMGNIRATLIPTIAVPVVLLGTFAVLWLFGFSINMLTMFAMVLAIGLLVDDAIVVVENVERIMSEEGISPREAAAKSMNQITPALIGIGLVLSAVFGPMACFSGSTGVIYRQFSVTVIASMLLSVLVALILSPVLCAAFLKPVPKGHQPAEGGVWFLRPFFKWFDRAFFWFRDVSVGLVSHTLRKKVRYLLLYAVIVAAMAFLFVRLPTSYLPNEDQGTMSVMATLPSGSTLDQTEAVMEKVREYFINNEKNTVHSVLTIAGQNQSGRGQKIGMAFVKLRDWHLRERAELKVEAVVSRATRTFATYREALVFAFAPPPIVELGNAKGFDFQLQDRGGAGHARLMEARNQILAMAAKDPRLTRVRPNGLEDVAQYQIDVDEENVGSLGVPLASLHDAISISFGSAYVNDFIKDGRVKHVDIQADAPFRRLPSDLEKLYVRNADGKMVPFSALPSINLWGEPAPGRSSGEAMQAMAEFASKLPNEFGFDWTGLSYQEREAGTQTLPLYAFSVLMIFLCLAALYESWPIPIAILLVLPLGVIGSTIASSLRGMPNDVYFQIGLLTTLGLATKNAILIVQFAKARLQQGAGLMQATLEGTRLRFRPIIMTSLAFGFGVLPLALANGAGAGAQNAIGTGVLGGMITGTVLVVLFAPLFYVLIQKAFGQRRVADTTTDTAPNPI